jgi:hypothetical protein
VFFIRPKAENETSTTTTNTTTTTIITAAAAAATTTTDKFKKKRDENLEANNADRKKSRCRRKQHIHEAMNLLPSMVTTIKGNSKLSPFYMHNTLRSSK